MTRPLVSVITPSYNPGARLRRCLESVAAQTYENVEHLIVDGGSTDGTVAILKESPAVRWVSEPDNGQSHALNKGFAMAKGELLTWINADDTLSNDAVAKVVEAWQRTGAEWIYGNCEMWDEKRSNLWNPPVTLDENSFDWVCPIAQQGTFFTKSAFERVGRIDESYDLSMDFDLWLRLFQAGVRSTFVPDVLARFEIHDESKTGSRGFHEFMIEGALALRRHDRKHSSDVMIGRAAAQLEVRRRSTPSISYRALFPAIQEVISSRAEFADADPDAVRAGALAEAADIELRGAKPLRHLTGLRHLLRLAPWRYALTRGPARAGLRIAGARSLERIAKR